MADDDTLVGDRTRDRNAPAAADAVAFTGGLGIAVGAMLLASEAFKRGHGRTAGIALFAGLIVIGWFALGILPRATHPAAVTLVVVGVPGAIGWWILPHAHRFADIRPFLILVIVVWAAFFIAPRTRGRSIFIAAALIVLWLWMLGEVAGTDAYSAAPIPSPPAHTMFSLSALHRDVTITDLDPSNSMYPLAQQCDQGNGAECDVLYEIATPGSDFKQFADTCGGAEPAGSGDNCASLIGTGSGSVIPPPGTGFTPNNLGVPGTSPLFRGAGHDKSLEIGMVSLFFGLAYVGALWAFDRRRWRTLGTALVIPGVLALFTGTEVLGNAAHHLWTGGLLTLIAGVGFAIVGEAGGRRFTTWAGGVFAAFGVYLFAGDVTNFKHSFTSENVQLVRPALITIAFGALLVALAWLIAMLRSQNLGPNGSFPTGATPPPPAPEPAAAVPPTFPPAVPPATPSPWQPPPAAPWDPPAT